MLSVLASSQVSSTPKIDPPATLRTCPGLSISLSAPSSMHTKCALILWAYHAESLYNESSPRAPPAAPAPAGRSRSTAFFFANEAAAWLTQRIAFVARSRPCEQ
jgi:hypothetical protein